MHKNINIPSNITIESPGNTMLGPSKMSELLYEMDYFVFLQTDNYMFRASGTFFDAVNYEKPIITLENDYISYYMRKASLCNLIFSDLFEIAEYINSPDFININNYHLLCQKVSNLKSLFINNEI